MLIFRLHNAILESQICVPVCGIGMQSQDCVEVRSLHKLRIVLHV